MTTPKLRTLPETRPAPHPVLVDIGCCSLRGEKWPNKDYALHDNRVGICVADGIGRAPMGDSLARLACHVAMEALRSRRSASAALRAAGAEVAKFASTVDSPGSGTSLLVAKPDGNTLDVAWAGDVGLFALPLEADDNTLLSNLGDGRRYGPLGIGLTPRHGTLVLPLEGIDKIAVCTNGAWRGAGVEGIAEFLAEDVNSAKIAASIAHAHDAHHDSTALVARVRAVSA